MQLTVARRVFFSKPALASFLPVLASPFVAGADTFPRIVIVPDSALKTNSQSTGRQRVVFEQNERRATVS